MILIFEYCKINDKTVGCIHKQVSRTYSPTLNIQLIRNEIKQLTPESGFNVILLDSFAPEGEKLTMVKHTEIKEEALLFQQEYRDLAKNGGVYAEQVFIYDKDTLFHFENKLNGESLC